MRMVKDNARRLLTLCMACAMTVMLQMMPCTASAQERAIEIKGDYTVMYPQMMELAGNETLLDVLLLYPDMIQSGFDELLTRMEPEEKGVKNTGYELRLDRVPIQGNPRTVLSTIKAKDVKMVMIYDNPGMSRNIDGLRGLIDVSLVEPKAGTQGELGLELGTDGMVTPMIKMTHGSKMHDVFALASYNKAAHASNQTTDKTNIYAEVTSRLTARDKVLTYLGMISESTDRETPAKLQYSADGMQRMSANMRWLHSFNDKGTELTVRLGYQYVKTPEAEMRGKTSVHRTFTAKSDMPIAIVSLSTPLPFLKGLSMNAGWECDIARHHIDVVQNNMGGNGKDFITNSTHGVMNNDLFVQLNYVYDMLSFTVGNRMQMYHYDMTSKRAGNWGRDVVRNLWQASVVVTPLPEHQVQLAYNRRLINPAYYMMAPEALPQAGGYYTIGNPNINYATADILRMAYGYTTKKMTAGAAVSYIRCGDYSNMRTASDNAYTWYSGGQSDTWKAEASAGYRMGDLSLTAGANYYTTMVKGAAKRLSYATGRLNAAYRLRDDWELNAALMLFTSKSPIRKAHNNCKAYGQIGASKALGKNMKASLVWHDVFESQRSAVMASVNMLF